jgi:hypothetical protein
MTKARIAELKKNHSRYSIDIWSLPLNGKGSVFSVHEHRRSAVTLA